MTHPGGRPKEYNNEVIEKAQDYLDFLPEDEKIHSIEGLSGHINIARSTIYEWCKHDDKKEFSDIVAKVLVKQGKKLLNKGLDGSFNASIVKLILSKHGYVEKSETDITTKGEQLNTLDPKLIALAKEYEERIKSDL